MRESWNYRQNAVDMMTSNKPIPVMIAENVSVGILSLPSAVATLGMVPYVNLTPRNILQYGSANIET